MSKIGLLNKKATKIMEDNNVISIPMHKKDSQAIYTLNMLYDFWLIYIHQNDLLHEQFVYPNRVINDLLSSEYKKYGGSEGGFILSKFLRMLTSLISYDTNLYFTKSISQQSEELKSLRSGYPIL